MDGWMDGWTVEGGEFCICVYIYVYMRRVIDPRPESPLRVIISEFITGGMRWGFFFYKVEYIRLYERK